MGKWAETKEDNRLCSAKIEKSGIISPVGSANTSASTSSERVSAAQSNSSWSFSVTNFARTRKT